GRARCKFPCVARFCGGTATVDIFYKNNLLLNPVGSSLHVAHCKCICSLPSNMQKIRCDTYRIARHIFHEYSSNVGLGSRRWRVPKNIKLCFKTSKHTP